LLWYVDKFEPADRITIRARLLRMIQSHYRRTPQPIATNAPHPVTGVSWDFLLMLAMRGDFKQRKQPGGRVFNDDAGRPLPRFWHRYVADLQQSVDAGTTADLAYPRRFPPDPNALIPDYAKDPG
jgi:hypothetical protein